MRAKLDVPTSGTKTEVLMATGGKSMRAMSMETILGAEYLLEAPELSATRKVNVV